MKFVAEAVLGRGVEATQGFVEKEDARFERQRPREHDALGLAAAEVVRQAVEQRPEVEQFDQARGALVEAFVWDRLASCRGVLFRYGRRTVYPTHGDRLPTCPTIAPAKANVLRNREMRKQRVGL